MKISSKYNNKFQILNALKIHFREYLTFYIIFFIAVIVGAVLGVLTILNTGVSIEIDTLTDTLLLEFMQDECSWITFLFYKLIESVFILALLFLTIYSVFLLPITLLILIYKTYYYFINLTILIKCLSIFGIMNTIFIIIPAYILTIFIYVIFACIITKIAFEFKCSRRVCFNDRMKNSLLKLFLFLLLARLIIIIYEIIMLLIFCNKFIIS
ncbi:MAG: hypothetical protein ACI4TX_05155 [Christensenellales bacterium]